MVQLYCQNPIKSCGLTDHEQGSRYWIYKTCGAIGEPLR